MDYGWFHVQDIKIYTDTHTHQMCVRIGVYPAYCIIVCLYTQTQSGMKNSLVVTSVYVHTSIYLFILFLGVKMCCRGILWKSYWHWFQCTASNSSMSVLQRDREICTSDAYFTTLPPLSFKEDSSICVNVLFGKLSPYIFTKQTNKQTNESYKSNKIKMYHIENACIHALNLSALREVARGCENSIREMVVFLLLLDVGGSFFILSKCKPFRDFWGCFDGNMSHGFKINYRNGLWWWWFKTIGLAPQSSSLRDKFRVQ